MILNISRIDCNGCVICSDYIYFYIIYLSSQLALSSAHTYYTCTKDVHCPHTHNLCTLSYNHGHTSIEPSLHVQRLNG